MQVLRKVIAAAVRKKNFVQRIKILLTLSFICRNIMGHGVALYYR
jgi:hypothetical protein